MVDDFKNTEIGSMPSDWDVAMLGDYCLKIGSGITPTGGQRVYQEEGHHFIRSQNVGWGKLILDDIVFIDDSIHQSFASTEICLGDVFLNITGASIGRSAVATQQLIGGNVNQHVCIIRTDKEKLNPIFLNHYLLSKRGQKQIDSFQSGGNRQGLNLGQLKSFRFPLPHIEEQSAIATALSDADALITSLEKLIAKKRLVKLGVMKKLLTPGSDWTSKRVGDITEVTTGGTPSTLRDEYWGGAIRWMNSGELNLKRVFEVENRITELGLASSATKLIPPYCVLIGLAGQGKTRGTVAMNMVELCTNQSIGAILPNSEICHDYLYHYLDSKYTELRNLSTGDGGRGGLNLSIIKNLQIPIPSTMDGQIHIATILNDLDAEINVLERKLVKQQQLKQGMMQNLLTGKIRLV